MKTNFLWETLYSCQAVNMCSSTVSGYTHLAVLNSLIEKLELTNHPAYNRVYSIIHWDRNYFYCIHQTTLLLLIF